MPNEVTIFKRFPIILLQQPMYDEYSDENGNEITDFAGMQFEVNTLLKGKIFYSHDESEYDAVSQIIRKIKQAVQEGQYTLEEKGFDFASIEHTMKLGGKFKVRWITIVFTGTEEELKRGITGAGHE